MNINKLLTFMCCILTLGLSTFSVAGVYKWTDANGKIHFSDKPHKNAAQITIKASKPTGIGTSNSQLRRQKELLLQYQNDREAKQKYQQKVNKRNAKIASQCKRLKNLITDYEEVDFLYTRNNKGKRNNLSNARKKQEIEKLKKEYNEKCQ